MIQVQIQRENRFFSSDGHYVCSTFTSNGLTAEIKPGQSIRFYGHFVYLDRLLCEKVSEDFTDRTLRVGDEVNVMVGIQNQIVRGQLVNVSEDKATIKPYCAKTVKRVPLSNFSALNRV
jgi:hypothetical protein